MEPVEAYNYCMANKLPYFDNKIMGAGQGSRHPLMSLLVKLECSNQSGKPFRILEIGSWAGASAVTWADAIKKYNSGNGCLVCVDGWVPYIHTQGIGDVYDIMTDALRKNTIYSLFENNIQATGHSDIVRTFKGNSEDVLPFLKDQSFEVVYIDGSHAYSNAIKDLENSARLVVDGGILCGDDLELQIDQIDIENAKANQEKDCIVDPKSGGHFHPGVTLAVAKFFGGGSEIVSNYSGFWAMRKSGQTWEKVNLSSQPLPAMTHLQIDVWLQDQMAQKRIKMEQLQQELLQTETDLENLQNHLKFLSQ